MKHIRARKGRCPPTLLAAWREGPAFQFCAATERERRKNPGGSFAVTTMAYAERKRMIQQEKEGLREGVPEGREMVAGVRSEERAETPDYVPHTECAPEAAREDRACPRLISRFTINHLVA